MASLLDIENTLSDETTRDIICKQWYWDEFLPKIDEDNIKNDYRLVYQEFSEYQWLSLPYDYPEYAWQWLLENKIMVLSSYSEDIDLYRLYDKYEDRSRLYRTIDDCYKYRLSDKFFEDYQKNIIERRKISAVEDWMYNMSNSPNRLYSQDKYLKYAYPFTFMPIV